MSDPEFIEQSLQKQLAFKDFRVTYKIITDPNLYNKDLKLYCLLELVHNQKITLDVAYDLCTQEGLFVRDWHDIRKKKSNVWEKYYER